MESPFHVADLIERSRPLKRLCALLRAHPLLVIPLFLSFYGYGSIDVVDFHLLSAAPLTLNANPRRQFLQHSPLTFFLGYPLTHTVGAVWSFAIVMLGGFAFFVVALGRFVAVRYRTFQHDAMLMFFATPLLIVLSQFLGKSDPYLVAFLLLLATSRNPMLQVLFGCLVVLSHLEIGLLVLGSAIFLRIVPFRTTLLGGLAGAFLVLGYHQYLLPSPPQSRADIGLELLSEAIDAVLTTPVLHLVLTFGPFWVCVLMAKRLDWRWLTACLGTALMAVSTLDFTRVFTLVGLPMIIAIVDRLVPRADTVSADQLTPRWFNALPLCAFFQAHLIADYVYDSRMPKLVGRLLEYMAR